MSKFIPFSYQIEGAKTIQSLGGRALLAHQMGLGKSAMALMWLKKRPDAWPAVIVCPASVKFGWDRHVLWILKRHAAVLEGKRAYSSSQAQLLEHGVLIINYDILSPWREYLKATGFKTLIIDEIHFCGNRKTLRTKACKELARHARYIIGLSGTPLTNRPVELFPGLNMIRPDIFKSFWSFGMEYCAPRQTPWGWQYKGASKIPELRKLLTRTCMIRRTKADVMSELPAKIRDIVVVPIDNPREYKHASKDFLNWLREQDPSKAKRARKAQQLTRMGYLKRLAAQLKMQAVAEWVNNWLESSEAEEKLVLFAVHKQIIEQLKKQCKAKSVVVDGSVTAPQRKLVVRQFREDKRTRLFIGNIQAAGTGLDGLQIANALAFVELAWRPGDHSQAEDRIHRIGLQETAWIYYLIAAGTIEEFLCRLIQEKQEVLSGILDGGRAVDDLDVFDRLVQMMRKEEKKNAFIKP